MWIFTRHGFLSVVQHNRDPGLLCVRARDEHHLIDFLGISIQNQILHPDDMDREPDYPVRVFVSREVFQNAMHNHLQNLDYTNFKGHLAATKSDPKYRSVCHDIWFHCHHLQSQESSMPYQF